MLEAFLQCQIHHAVHGLGSPQRHTCSSMECHLTKVHAPSCPQQCLLPRVSSISPQVALLCPFPFFSPLSLLFLSTMAQDCHRLLSLKFRRAEGTDTGVRAIWHLTSTGHCVLPHRAPLQPPFTKPLQFMPNTFHP